MLDPNTRMWDSNLKDCNLKCVIGFLGLIQTQQTQENGVNTTKTLTMRFLLSPQSEIQNPKY